MVWFSESCGRTGRDALPDRQGNGVFPGKSGETMGPERVAGPGIHTGSGFTEDFSEYSAFTSRMAQSYANTVFRPFSAGNFFLIRPTTDISYCAGTAPLSLRFGMAHPKRFAVDTEAASELQSVRARMISK